MRLSRREFPDRRVLIFIIPGFSRQVVSSVSQGAVELDACHSGGFPEGQQSYVKDVFYYII
jgi:hypothetical protein